MERIYPLLFLLALIVVACSPEAEPAMTTPPTPETATEVAEARVGEIEQTGAAPTEVVPTEAPTATAGDPTNTPDVEPAEEISIEPTATLIPAIEEEVVFNGPYENTYFRGSAAAPVTMIDYSDFL